MFAPPSYLYSGLDKDTIELTNELDDLGGGDVKISNMKLYANINTHIKATDRQVLWNYSSMLGIRDITLPRNSPVTKSMQYFPITDIILSNHLNAEGSNYNDSIHSDNHINNNSNSGSDTHHHHHHHHHHHRINDKYSDVINDILSNIDRGFNVCLLSFGMSNSGKTYHLFGDLGCHLNSTHSYDRLNHTKHSSWDSIAYSCLDQLYHNYHQTNDYHTANTSVSTTTITTTIALSCWFVQCDRTTDLLAPISNNNYQTNNNNNNNKSSSAYHPLDFTSVECPTFDIAVELLHHCRSRAKGCLSKHHHHNHDHSYISTRNQGNDHSVNSIEQHLRGHFFFRILIHRKGDNHHYRQHHHNDSNDNDNSTPYHRNDHDCDDDDGSVAYLYLIDLTGFVSSDSQFFKQLDNKQQVLCRDNNLQLQTLLKVFHEMVDLSKAASIHNIAQTLPLSPSSPSSLLQQQSSSHQTLGQYQPIVTVDGSDSMIKMTSARGCHQYHHNHRHNNSNNNNNHHHLL